MSDTKSEASIESSTVMYVEKFFYDELATAISELKAKHERVLQMLEIAKKALLAISLPIADTINTTEVERLQMEAARETLAQIESLK